ncbi:hypothetical protein BN1723_003804 [Verticillium longisporum]|uniref:Inositol oxygenase n=1 Tax=Verticillium longisporum TaxID=100787 RepID=A0A0G4MDR7_VERLO|nr:hypothetical protein BN1723_003804 [Verticillium longisporum]
MSEDIKAAANHGDARASAESHAAADDAKMSNAFVQGARDASSREQNMTLMQGIRLYPKAIGWSMLISTCIVMEGYDISLVSNFFAFDPFKKNFYPWHREGAYREFMAPGDDELLDAVLAFNPYDLYSKSDDAPTVEELRPYYQELIDEYFPKRVIRW